MSSTKLGKHFSLSATRMNLLLAELGWIEKYTKGWKPTVRGYQMGAEAREIRRSGVPYVVWPSSIQSNKILLTSIADAQGGKEEEIDSMVTSGDPPTRSSAAEFRERFPARFRATDGHLVRSRAEMLIDNWLYMQGIVHAVERKLPIEEDMYCDFYLPTGKIYIEYWGLENDPKYAARKAEKQGIYNRYDLNLVELVDDDIMGLDDVLPRHLLKFGIDCT
ncbi:MAG: glycerol kinase [Phycisphaerales bacterium]